MNTARVVGLSLMTLISVVAPLGPVGAPAALAQTEVKALEPHVVVVTRAGTPLRCGPAVVYYEVSSLNPGALLRVDGESGAFFRVRYPAGMRAYVRAADVKGGQEFVELQRPSKLLAANAAAGDRGSWFPLLETALEPGVKLTVMEVIKDGEGKPTMYAVAAPAQARGFVNRESVRKATDEEAKGLPADGPTAPPSTTPATTPASTPVPTGAAAPTPAPAGTAATTPAATGANAPAGGGTQAVPTAQPGTTTPVPSTTPVTATPATGPEGQPVTNVTPPVETVQTPPPPPPAPIEPSKSQQLMALYESVRKQPLQEAELDQAITAFESHIATLGGSGSQAREAQVLSQYVTVLKARRDLRETLRASDTSKAQLATRNAELARQLAELDKQQVYKAIGRLVPSTVYDGTALPKLYRLLSPEPGAARTLGYLSPQEGLDLDLKVGRIIGVVGEERMDAGLNAIILVPVRVDVLNINAAISTPVTPAPAPAAPAGQP